MMSDHRWSPRSESLIAGAALTLLLAVCSGLFSSCGGDDLIIGGTGVVTATPIDTVTPTP
jgi:hypothetical protein